VYGPEESENEEDKEEKVSDDSVNTHSSNYSPIKIQKRVRKRLTASNTITKI